MFFSKNINIQDSLARIEARLDKLAGEVEAPAYVSVNDTHFKVAQHWFWKQYVERGWEPQTYQIMKRHLVRNRDYLDIGTWVGPTILYAAELGVERIWGVEANPLTHANLLKTIQMNRCLKERVKIFHGCICDQEGGVIPFGGKNGADTSSASSMRGNTWTVPATTILSFIKHHEINDIGFIKIDVEGAEMKLIADLQVLSCQKNLAIYLSLHPPFWGSQNELAQTGELLCQSLSKSIICDSLENELTKDQLMERITCKTSHPKWGTEFGNFFEILVFAR
jgi:FkbM family methyltransferase